MRSLCESEWRNELSRKEKKERVVGWRVKGKRKREKWL